MKENTARITTSTTNNQSDGYKPQAVPAAFKIINGSFETTVENNTAKSDRMGQRPESKEKSRIRSIASIEVPVTDINRSVDFYVNYLGFYMDVLKNPLPIEPGNTEVFVYPASGPNLMLVQTEGLERMGFSHKGKRNRMLIFETDQNPEECYSDLVEAGFKVEEISDGGDCGRSLDIHDPDGNIITLWFGFPN
jgi:catechol 2,3-dioxygenase-like lactoylglutathione lyase family enzyme